MLGTEEAERVAQVLSGPQLVHGPVAEELEQRFAERAGVEFAVSTSSCTASLHLSLFALALGAKDEIIVPAMTHVATAHAAEFCGVKPVFADVDPESGNIDPDCIADVLGEATRAVIVVHYLGLPCDMDRINALAAENELTVIEDCALAVDASYDGQKAGGLGLAGCFSFYPIKHMTTAEGGMLTTNDPVFAQAIRQRKAFGYDRTLRERQKPGIYDVTALGYNYRMSEVHAAIGLAQMEKLDLHQKQRAENFAALKAQMDDIEEVIVFEPVQGKAVSSHYCLNAVLPKDRSLSRDLVVESLREQGIGTSVHYPAPVPLMAYYREKYGYKPGQFANAEWLADQTISLPVGPHLEDGDIERIGDAMKTAIARVKTSR
jgi:dTDP-4-amino-4,6-dideoxygalactose transaminase